MTDVMLARARIEPGKEGRLREWYRELRDRKSEVHETLEHEGVQTETAFIDDGGDASYLYVYMEAIDLERADEAGDEEAYEIDAEHHAVLRETLAADWEPIETIAHFTNPDRE